MLRVCATRLGSAGFHEMIPMPEVWGTQTFRDLARSWQERADALPPGKERDQRMAIADGYARLAQLREKSDLSAASYEPLK